MLYSLFLSLKVNDEMQHYAVFHLGRHCLQKSLFIWFPVYTELRSSGIQIDPQKGTNVYLNSLLAG